MRSAFLLLILISSTCLAYTDHEVEIPLDRWNRIEVGGCTVSTFVHDVSILTFKATCGGGQRLQSYPKADGQDREGTNITEFFRCGRSILYFVNTPRSKPSCCILLIRDF